MDENKDKKSFKKLIFIWIVLTIPIILIFILSLVDYLKLPVTYDDVMYQEVTFSYYTESSDSENSGITFRIFVDELDKPLYINNLITSKNLILKVYDFKKGEKFYCYYMEKKYEVVEMGTNIPFITLNDYNNIMQENNKFGVVISPILLVILNIIMVSTIIIDRKK